MVLGVMTVSGSVDGVGGVTVSGSVDGVGGDDGQWEC